MIDKKFIFENNEIDIDGVGDAFAAAVLICLLTDAPASAEELEAAGLTENAGWHGDRTLEKDGEISKAAPWGSKLWLLKRAKISSETLFKIQDYAREALAPLTEAGLATLAHVEAAADGERVTLFLQVESRDTAYSLSLSNLFQGVSNAL